MKPRLAVIGLNHRASPVAVGEGFWERFRRSFDFASDLMISGSRKRISWGQEFGPLTEEPDDVLTTLARTSRSALEAIGRELRELPDRSGQGMLTAAVRKLFQLDNPDLSETGQEN